MQLSGTLKVIFFIAAAGCAFAAMFISVGSGTLTRATETALFYLLLAAIAFTVAGFVTRLVERQRG